VKECANVALSGMWVVINCVLVKQSSEIPISKIHEATRYSASLKLTLCVEIVAEKFRVRCFRANLVVEKRVWFCSAEQIYNSKLLLFDGLQLTTRRLSINLSFCQVSLPSMPLIPWHLHCH
jgi:hypothetical protein